MPAKAGSGHPEEFEILGFRLALAIASLAGITLEIFNELPIQQPSSVSADHLRKISPANTRFDSVAIYSRLRYEGPIRNLS